MMSDSHGFLGLSDKGERGENPLPLLLFSLASILMVLFSNKFPTLFFTCFFYLVWLLSMGISLKKVLKRLSGPLAVALVLLVTQSLFHGKDVIASIKVGSLTISVFREGLWRGLLLLCKIVSGSLVMVNITFSMSVPDFLGCLSLLKVPGIVILEALLTYRYLFLLRDEALRIRQAQIIRGGYISWRKGVRSVSLLGSSLVINSLERASRAQDAARLRMGSQGGLPAFSRLSGKMISRREAALLSAAFLVLLVAWWIYHVKA
jgi:cobalt/nickel transport system permease protein